MTIPKPGDEVRVGQVWANVDPRKAGRTLRVEAVGGGKVTLIVVTNSYQVQRCLDAPPNANGYRPCTDMRGKREHVQLDRMRRIDTHHGYRLVEKYGTEEKDDD